MDDYKSNTNLSLREKWRLHREAKKKRMSNWNSPLFLHKWGPYMFLFVYSGVGGWGAFVAIPTLYKGGWEEYVMPTQAFAMLILVEVFVNWCLTRWTPSEYIPEVHGAKPDDLSEPDDEMPASENGDGNRGAEKERKDSTENGKLVDDNINSCMKRHNATKLDDEDLGNGIPMNNKQKDLGPSAARTGPPEVQEPFVQDKDTEKTKSNTAESKQNSSNKKSPENSRPRDGLSFRMLVATSLPDKDGHVTRKSVPYWSWVQCFICRRLRPPRCHHCVLCNCCILKRDHHCYLTGACIALHNQRHFLVFLIWAVSGCIFATVHMLPYTFKHVLPDYNISYFDFVPPICFIRGVLGYISMVVFLLCLEFWLLLFFTVFTSGMLVGELELLFTGLTSFERENRIKITDTRSMGGKLQAVFGDSWWLSVLVPTLWTKPYEDAVLWPAIKP